MEGNVSSALKPKPATSISTAEVRSMKFGTDAEVLDSHSYDPRAPYHKTLDTDRIKKLIDTLNKVCPNNCFGFTYRNHYALTSTTSDHCSSIPESRSVTSTSTAEVRSIKFGTDTDDFQLDSRSYDRGAAIHEPLDTDRFKKLIELNTKSALIIA